MTVRSVRSYVVAVVAAGAAAVAATAVAAPWSPLEPVVIATLGVAIAVSISTPIRFHRRAGIQAFHANDGILLGLLPVTGLGVVPLIAAAAALVGNGLRSRDPVKVAFNVGAHGASAAAATWAFAAVWDGGDILAPRTALALAAASTAYSTLDSLLYARLFATIEHRPVADVLRDSFGLARVSAVGAALLGLLLALVVSTQPAASALVFVLLVGAHVGYQGYALAQHERDRNARLRQVTRTLVEAIDSPEATGRYLEAVASLFGAGAAELLLVHPRQRVRYEAGTATAVPAELQPGHPLLEAIRRGAPVVGAAGGPAGSGGGPEPADVLAVPVVHSGLTIGALAVRDRSGLELQRSRDLQLLESLAAEAGVVLQNVELFASLRRERARLAEETQKLQDVVGAASDGIALIDADGRVVTWNPAMEQATGVRVDEAVGHPWFMALRLRDASGADVPVDGPPAMRAASRGERAPDPVDVQVLRRDGEWRWLRCTFSPVVRGATGPVGVVVVARDVTHEREAEEMKNDFIATVSHELRTPLTPLKGFLITALEHHDRLTDEQLDTFHRSMLRQVERLETLVADLLVVADLDRGSLRLRSESTELVAACEQAVAAEVPPDAAGRVRLDAAGPVSVVGDRRAVLRIVRALLDNALKHTDAPITVAVERYGDAGVVSVRDEGPGIPPRYHTRIFERFGRLGDHLTRTTQGSGLGLAIARSLAERMGGDLTVESRPGRGSTFRLELRLCRPEAVPDRGPGDRVGSASAASPTSRTPSPLASEGDVGRPTA